MEEPARIVLLITTADAGEAHQIARALLEQRLAACANIIPGVSSHFWWQGKIDSAAESLLILKTTTTRLKEVVIAIRQLHSETVPEIIALPIIGGNPDYLGWIDKEVK